MSGRSISVRVPISPYRRAFGWLLLFAILTAASSQGPAESASADEYEIRAAMLMNLTKFIDWPAWKLDASHPQFLICILGPDPIGPAADRYLLNTTAGGEARTSEAPHLGGRSGKLSHPLRRYQRAEDA